MGTTNPFDDFMYRLGCERRRRQLVRDLHALTDQQLLDVGIWRGAIPETAAQILSGQGCPARDG